MYLNVFSNEFLNGDIAIFNGLIAGIGEYSGKIEVDVNGKLVLPGFIDAHIHIDSVTPKALILKESLVQSNL